jgi:predicted transcriptional regulator
MPRTVKISADQLLKWAEELYRRGKLKREEYELLREYLTYHDPDILDKFPEPPEKYEIFRFPFGYKPTKDDYVRIALQRALEWKRYWKGKEEEERRELERRKKLAISLAPFRERVARELVSKYGKVVKEFEDRADELGLTDEPVVEWIVDLKYLVFNKPKLVKSESEVRELIQEIEKLVKKIDKELKEYEEFEKEWERLSPEERKRRAEEAERKLRELIFGKFE